MIATLIAHGLYYGRDADILGLASASDDIAQEKANSD